LDEALAVSCNPLLCGRPRQTIKCAEQEVEMEMVLTAVFRQVPEGYVAFVEELPGANTQGATLEEARENLREAVELVIEANRAMAREELGSAHVVREPLKIAG
jgi:predicted RNase H-like HicB family nuclease